MGERAISVLLLGPVLDGAREVVEQLERRGAITVVGRTGDPAVAVRMCRDRKPSCALLFVRSSAQVALAAALMRDAPLPLVAVPSTTRLGIEALSAGVVEALEVDASAATIAEALLVMSGVTVVGRRQGPRATGPTAAMPAPRGNRPLVLIGTSAGGPIALVQVLAALPRDFPAPVVVVQHMPDDYHPTYVAWLREKVSLRVRLADAGASLEERAVFVAPGGQNLVLGPGGFFVPRPRSASGPCPSVDVLFASAAALAGFSVCAVVLTGMGHDGAKGLLAIREAGGFTLVQDRATSIVFGMPAEALRVGAAELALPPPAIAEQLKLWANGSAAAADRPWPED